MAEENKKIYLSSPTMHGEELLYMKEAFDTNWMSTVGKNINEVERLVCERVGVSAAVGDNAFVLQGANGDGGVVKREKKGYKIDINAEQCHENLESKNLTGFSR